MPARLLTLEDSFTRLTLAPQTGAAIVNWSVLGSDLPLLRHSDAAAIESGLPGKLGCYGLIPWSNRIAQGGFQCPEGWLALTPNNPGDPLPIHGSAWQQPWEVLEQQADSVLLELHADYPFAYRARQRVQLKDGCLSIELQVTHLESAPAWHGLGLHPYFPRRADSRLQAHAEQVWHCAETRLPTELGALPPAWNFRQANDLPPTLVDNGFTEWDGQCRIIEASAGYQLLCQASGADYFLLYCPPGKAFFCFEPVSHPVNAHHLPGHPGLRLLEQGQSTELTFSLQYQPL
jgi:aldose 1-epimerase